MSHHLTYLEAVVTGLVQGVTELFPVSSLGHNVLIPALLGGSWANTLNVSDPNSPYLAFVVGLHVATAIAMIAYFWRDWLRIVRGFISSLRTRSVTTPDERLAWMIILATIPVGIAGLVLEHDFRVYFSKPILTALFLALNGVILLAGEQARKRRIALDEQQSAAGREAADREMAAARPGAGRHAAGQRAMKEQQASLAVQSDRRLTQLGWLSAFGLGAAQIFALLPGISRDGIVMVCGMFRGLSRQDAARFSFLLSAPVILAAGVLKIPDLTGPLGAGVRGQVLVGSIVSGVGAYLALRFLVRYYSDSARTLTPFAIYCLAAGIGSAIYLTIR